uniref:Uncharacterized protein n=1 Tax=Rhizophora mucronata TaxID=61149 RepID=A0A2P2IQP5_RHIMU
MHPLMSTNNKNPVLELSFALLLTFKPNGKSATCLALEACFATCLPFVGV